MLNALRIVLSVELHLYIRGYRFCVSFFFKPDSLDYVFARFDVMFLGLSGVGRLRVYYSLSGEQVLSVRLFRAVTNERME